VQGSRDYGADVLRWRKEYSGLQVDRSWRLKELEQDNAKLKRPVLKDIASGNF
jgi:hypothetical protein